MTCPKCNHKLPDDSEFCQYCGSKIETSTIEFDNNKAEVKEEPITEEVIIPTVDNETAAKILASGIIEGQKAMEANRESQPHNELDADFGLVPQKPVYTVGIDEQEKYLKSLRTINGEAIKWNRRGSMNVDGVNGMVDVYDTYLPSGEEYKTVYINMYGASNSTFAPKGFSYLNQTTATPISPIKKQNGKKSKKHKIALLITGVVAVVAILFFVFAMPEINYQRANNLLNEEKFDAARLAFEDLGNYRDSKEMINECLYQKACSLLDDDLYDSAITLFEELDGYKKSEDKIDEAKYGYIIDHRNNTNTTTFAYLKNLKNKDYKDCANIYKELYEWKITVLAVNSDKDDDSTNKSSIKKNAPVYFHIDLSGGEPNESIRITVKSTWPNGNTSEYTFDSKWDKWSAGWYGWSEGPSITGTIRCYFYDEDGNMIGGGSVKIVE